MFDTAPPPLKKSDARKAVFGESYTTVQQALLIGLLAD